MSTPISVRVDAGPVYEIHRDESAPLTSPPTAIFQLCGGCDGAGTISPAGTNQVVETCPACNGGKKFPVPADQWQELGLYLPRAVMPPGPPPAPVSSKDETRKLDRRA